MRIWGRKRRCAGWRRGFILAAMRSAGPLLFAANAAAFFTAAMTLYCAALYGIGNAQNFGEANQRLLLRLVLGFGLAGGFFGAAQAVSRGVVARRGRGLRRWAAAVLALFAGALCLALAAAAGFILTLAGGSRG